ncbi:hypothetical protein LCGC14_3047670, partial [marine sediment metagenome]
PDRRREETTTALRAEDGAKIAGTCLAWVVGEGENRRVKSAYCPARHLNETAGGRQMDPRRMTQPLSDHIRDMRDGQLVIVHHLGMELSFMLGEDIAWPRHGQIHDTMIAARVLNKGVGWKELIGLKSLQAEHLGRDMSSKNELDRWLKSKRLKPGKDIWKAPVVLAGYYGQDDARDTLLLWFKWEHLVYQSPTQWWWSRPPDKRHRHDLYEMEIEAGINAIRDCLRGMRFDVKLARSQTRAAHALQEVARRWIRQYLEMPTVNPGSATQIRGIIFSERFSVEVSLDHLTMSFHKLKDRDQSKVLAGAGPKALKDYASLDIDALKFYGDQVPEHSDFLFMLAIRLSRSSMYSSDILS